MKPREIAKIMYEELKSKPKDVYVFIRLDDYKQGLKVLELDKKFENREEAKEFFEQPVDKIGIDDMFGANPDKTFIIHQAVARDKRLSIKFIQNIICTVMEDSIYWKKQDGDFCLSFIKTKEGVEINYYTVQQRGE